MKKIISMKDPTGAGAYGYIGFETAFFIIGPLVPLMRGHLVAFFTMLLIGPTTAIGLFTLFEEAYGGPLQPGSYTLIAALTGLAYDIVFGYTYNDWHRSWLLRRAYLPVATTLEAASKPQASPAEDTVERAAPALHQIKPIMADRG